MASYVHRIAKERGLKMVDGKKPIVLNLTTRDLKAVRKNPEQCGFAKAARRENEEVKAAYIFKSTAWLEFSDRMVHYYLPMSVQKEIVAFDRGGALAPGEYKLVPPSPSGRIGANKKGGHSRKPGSKPSGVRHITTDVRSSREWEPGD